MQPTIVLDARDQLLAFACAGHPRCGAASPARLLWLRDPRAAAAVRDACFFQRSFRVAVFEGHHKPYHVLAFGVSPATLGVTSAPVLAPLAPLAPPKGRDSADRVLSENMVLTWDSPSRDMFVLSRQSSCGEGNYHDWPRKLALRGAEWDRYLLPIVHGRWMILRSRVGGEIVVVDLEAPEPHETMARMAPPWYLVHVANYRRFSDEVVLLAQDHPNESLLIALVDLRRTFTSRSLAVVSVIRFPNEALPEGWKWFEAGMSLGMRAFHLKKQKQHRNYRLVDEIGSGGSGDGDGDGGDVALVDGDTQGQV
ncbi:hypothetical protein Pelo_17875 [Pelomyxa schiedti]|nr:hypothetical protein Pelo_17875 [Pelomyxa schiedti]